jgi:nucleoid DNA-binding protein
LKPSEIVAAVRAKDAKIIGEMADKKAEQIVKAALTIIRESVVAVEKGDLTVPMLGRFKVNEVTKGEGAEAKVVRKVTYVAAKAQVKEAPPNGKPKAKAKAEA